MTPDPRAAFDVTARVAAIGVRADITDYDALRGVVDAAVARFGGLDILVNNAVDPSNGLIADLTPELAESNDRANVLGPMFLAQHAQPHLTASGHGSIINVISVAVWVGSAGQALYRGSKAALHGVTRVMAKEWAPAIRANTIAPGPFQTTSTAVSPLARRTGALQQPVASRMTAHACAIRAAERIVTRRRNDDRATVWMLSKFTTQSLGTPSRSAVRSSSETR